MVLDKNGIWLMVFDKKYWINGIWKIVFDKVYLIKSISAVINYNSSSCLHKNAWG